MHYNEKVLRKAIKEVVQKYRSQMMGRYPITDFSDTKWLIEYNLLIWKDGKYWDMFNGGYTQKDLFDSISRYCFKDEYKNEKFSVEVALMSGCSTNRSVIFNLDGSKNIDEDV